MYNSIVDYISTTDVGKIEQNATDTRRYQYKLKILEFLAKESAQKLKQNGLYTIQELDDAKMLDIVLYVSSTEDKTTLASLLDDISLKDSIEPEVSAYNITECLRYGKYKAILDNADNIDNDVKFELYIKMLKLKYVLGKPVHLPVTISEVLKEMYPIDLTGETKPDESIIDKYNSIIMVGLEELLYKIDDHKITTDKGWDSSITDYVPFLPEWHPKYSNAEGYAIGLS